MARALAPQKTYDLKYGNRILVGGVLIGGYAEDGGIEYEYGSDVFEPLVGADGQATVSMLNDNSMTATLTLMETSPAYRDLMILLTAQINVVKLGLPVPPLPFVHADSRNGDAVFSGFCVFLNKPAPSKSRTVGEREFRLFLAQAADNITLGALNLA